MPHCIRNLLSTIISTQFILSLNWLRERTRILRMRFLICVVPRIMSCHNSTIADQRHEVFAHSDRFSFCILNSSLNANRAACALCLMMCISWPVFLAIFAHKKASIVVQIIFSCHGSWIHCLAVFQKDLNNLVRLPGCITFMHLVLAAVPLYACHALQRLNKKPTWLRNPPLKTMPLNSFPACSQRCLIKALHGAAGTHFLSSWRPKSDVSDTCKVFVLEEFRKL